MGQKKKKRPIIFWGPDLKHCLHPLKTGPALIQSLYCSLALLWTSMSYVVGVLPCQHTWFLFHQTDHNIMEIWHSTLVSNSSSIWNNIGTIPIAWSIYGLIWFHMGLSSQISWIANTPKKTVSFCSLYS
jgi:hypothetical protein